MANLPHVSKNFQSSSSDSLIISDILCSASLGTPVAHRPQLRAVSFKIIYAGFPQGGLSLFQSSFQ
jgi:hypothetical protein